MSNSVQLKHVLKQGQSHPFYGTQVTLGIISVLMCTSIGKFKTFVLGSSPSVYEISSTFPSRILGFIQLYTFLFTRLDRLSRMAKDQLVLLLLTIFLFLFNISFLIIMFKF